jgi:predicted metalloprotease with PDZ domain
MRPIKWYYHVVLAVFAVASIGTFASPIDAQTLTYRVDLNDRSDDLFHVHLEVEGLTEANAILQFASTAPGTYQVMDIGRFVRDLEVLDADGRPVPVEQVATNQWRISDPDRARVVRYSIAETWDTPVDENNVYPMAGTSIEEDHVLINAHAVFPYPTGMQDAAIRVYLTYPAEWEMGTPLDPDADGALLADDYDHLVDSPILLGRLSFAETEVAGAPVTIYTYSKTDQITSEQLLGSMDSILVAAGEFLGELPVDRYTFLFHFEDNQGAMGAWEHSYSSEYVLVERPYSERYGTIIADIAAHEFFHVVTPLNIHSEIIQNFNFVTPVPSEHLWLYEGTTEWASDAMQLRGGLKSPDAYLAGVAQKMRADKFFDESYTLSQLALTSFTPEGQQQYANIYQRGALVAGLLDIRLLELSGGEYGLQELVLDLAEKFGKDQPFPEDEFFDIVVEMTYPEIGEFFEMYVKNAEPLPMAEYYGELGIEIEYDDRDRPSFVVDPEPTDAQRALRDAWLSNP